MRGLAGERDLARSTVRVTANGELTVGCPVAIYRGANGKLMGIKSYIDANTDMRKIGVPEATIATGTVGEILIDGALPFVSGGTPGKYVTAVSIAGAVTAATDVTATNANLGTVKGYCISTGILFKTVEGFL